MNTLLISIIFVPVIEIYLFIKVGSQIGALKTISLILLTAIIGMYYARHEGLNTLRSGFSRVIKNELPAYELVSGAAIAFAAILLIVPGFATDIIGFLIIIPVTRKILLNRIFKNLDLKKEKKKNFIDGEYEDIKDDDDRKL